MPVSIKDIAKMAGVSPSTVSRALQDHPRISNETKTNIQNLAKEMGYVPSAAARNLVAKRSATIGIVINHLSDPYYDRLVSGIEKVAFAHNYQVILSCSHRNPERELTIINDFHERRMDGIIVAGSEVAHVYLSSDSKFFRPIILINRPAYPYSVSGDGFLGAKKAAEHLVRLGHRRIAYITWGSQHPDGPNRLKGYQTALNQHNITTSETLIVAGDGGIVGGIKAVNTLLDLSHKPTAIFCFNDMTAIGVINALRNKGYQVPRDISVVGYDDLEIASYYFPPLTTVRQPTFRIGKCAAIMLFRLINGDPGVVPKTVKPEFIIRGSTAPVAA